MFPESVMDGMQLLKTDALLECGITLYYIQSLDRRAERLSGPALPYIHRHKQGGLGVLC